VGGREADHALPAGIEVTNEWSYISTPHIPSGREHGHHLLEPEDILPCDILASHSGVCEDSNLLGYYTT
jgi:hypothetical protein